MQADSQMGVGSSIIGLSVKRETIHVLSYGKSISRFFYSIICLCGCFGCPAFVWGVIDGDG